MLDFNQLPRFKPKAYEIIKMIPVWAHSFHVTDQVIFRQIQIASAWCDSNPSRAPRRDIIRFMFNWLTKAQHFGNLVESRPLAPTQPPKLEPMSSEEMREIRIRNMGPANFREEQSEGPQQQKTEEEQFL